jgi:hypothetical protein
MLIISNLLCIVFLLVFSTNVNGTSTKCLILVNDKIHESNKTLLISDNQNYHLAFGSLVDKPKNAVVGYSIDVKCSLNSSSISNFYYDIKNLPIEINVLNCSKELTFRNIALFNNGSIDFFLFETRLLKSNITDLYVNITINRRYGNGCTGNLYFSKNISFKIQFLDRIDQIWTEIKSNYLCFLIMILLIVTLIILTVLSVSQISKYFVCETKPIQINLPSIKFTKTSKNVRFDSLSHLTETNNPSIAENLDAVAVAESTETKVADESTQADMYNQFQTIRDQFNLKKSDQGRISDRSSQKNHGFISNN